MKKDLFVVSLLGYKEKYDFVNQLNKAFNLIDVHILGDEKNLDFFKRKIHNIKNVSYILYLLPANDRAIKKKKYINNLKKINFIKKKVSNNFFLITFEIIYSQIQVLDLFLPNIFFYFLRIVNSISNIFIKDYYKYFPPTFTILTGLKTIYKIPLSKTNNIFWHSHDYETYKKYIRKKNNQMRTAIYLDQPFDVNFDKYYTGNNPDKSFGVFYEKLKKFLDNVEYKYNLKVIIANHPRRENFQHSIFKKFENYNNKTAELISNCKLVFAHCSLSISFATLFNKDMVFLSSEELDKSIYNKRINIFSKFFGCSAIKIPKENIDLSKYYANKQKYPQYIKNYVKNENSENVNFKDLILKRIDV